MPFDTRDNRHREEKQARKKAEFVAQNSIDLEWLVHSRERIQKLLLNLYKYGKAQKGDTRYNPIFSILIGAAFSLWRAVFLTPPVKAYELEWDQSMDFLKKLIETNAVAFAQEKSAAFWVGEYYTLNAMLRLSALPEIASSLQNDTSFPKEWGASLSAFSEGEEAKSLLNLRAGNLFGRRAPWPKERWDTAFDGLELAFSVLKSTCR